MDTHRQRCPQVSSASHRPLRREVFQMKYVISIERVHDGAKVAHMFEDDDVAGANFDLLAKRANDLWKSINLEPLRHERKDWMTPEGREAVERHHAKQVLFPYNPVRNH